MHQVHLYQDFMKYRIRLYFLLDIWKKSFLCLKSVFVEISALYFHYSAQFKNVVLQSTSDLLPVCFSCLLPLCFQCASSVLPVCFQPTSSVLPVCFKSTSSQLPVRIQSTFSLNPVHFQSTSSPLPVCFYYTSTVLSTSNTLLNDGFLFQEKISTTNFFLHTTIHMMLHFFARGHQL